MKISNYHLKLYYFNNISKVNRLKKTTFFPDRINCQKNRIRYESMRVKRLSN